MTDAGLRTVRFVSDALPDDTFDLLDLHGLEELNRLFSFHLRLAVREPARVRGQTQALLEAPAFLVFFDDGQEVRRVHGVLSELSLDLDVELDQAELTVTLVPRVWALTQRQATELALDKTVPQLLVERLSRLGLKEGDDFQLRLLGRHEPREMVVQHQESDWAFLCRLCEQVGIFFAFAHASGRDVVVFGDQPDELWSSPPVEVPYRRRGDTRGAFAVREEVRRGPSAVQLSDYNYRLPGVGLRGQHEVEGPGGWGVQRLWGEHVKTPEEADARAEVRAQQSAQERVRVSGQTTELALTAGSVLVLTEPLGTERRVLVTRLASHVSMALGPDGGLQATSETSFDGLPEGVPFRPGRRTPWPRVPGLVHAVVDGAADGTYAELDEQGRYQVVFGHDATTQGAMRRSRPVRMLQPHGGGDYGMHFPLRPGTEVLVGHVEGDPDRPVIVGVAPNPATSSPVGAGNATQNVLRSGSRNEMVMEDMLGQERIRLHTPHQNTTLQLGSESEPEEGLLARTDGHMTHVSGQTMNEATARRTRLAEQSTDLIGYSAVTFVGAQGMQGVSSDGAQCVGSHAARLPLVSEDLRSFASDDRTMEKTEESSVAPTQSSQRWSELSESLSALVQSGVMQAAREKAQRMDAALQSSGARTQGERIGELPEPALLQASTKTASLLARDTTFVHAGRSLTLGSAEGVSVVGQRSVHVESPEEVEISGRRTVRITSSKLVDVRTCQLSVLATRSPDVFDQALPPEVAVAVVADKTVRIRSVEGALVACASQDITLHSHQKGIKVVAKGTVSMSGGSINCSSGSFSLTTSKDATADIGGDASVKVAGTLSLKATDLLIEASTVTITAGSITLEGATLIKGSLDVKGSISGG